MDEKITAFEAFDIVAHLQTDGAVRTFLDEVTQTDTAADFLHALSTAARELISIRLDADVLDGLRATGKGWQTRVNAVMRDWLKTHRRRS